MMPTTEIIQISILGACPLVAVFVTFLCVRGWPAGRFLCDDCKYNHPQMCNKAERPKALVCAAYVSGSPPRT